MYGSSRQDGSSAASLLDTYIERACSPLLSQPNLSLNLEIADLINQKKANTPREAAVAVLQYINRRNTHISMLGLHLLDILVKNCGYPFHLQIATKEFLNELVRRFPEKPPVFPPPPMQKILEMIHEWKVTICSTSKHKEDLVHIRDMHRLLSYKGYRFPEIDRRAAQVLNESDRLKSAEELEEEDRAAQAAKLQELIRRGTPKDLAAAQELMKIMAGAEPDKQPNYQAQMQKELDRVQSRVLLLNELLNNAKPGEKFVEGDAFDQIAQKCKQVQPKLQKWIGEAEESQPNMMDQLLLINDLINNVLNRYAAFKNGDFTATAEINPAFVGKETAAVVLARAQEVSLIDFDDPVQEATTPTLSTTSAVTANSVAADLGGLSLSSPSSSTTSTTTTTTRTGPGGLPMGLFDALSAPVAASSSSSPSSVSTSTASSTPSLSSSTRPPLPSPLAAGVGGAYWAQPQPGPSSWERSPTPIATNTPTSSGVVSVGGSRAATASNPWSSQGGPIALGGGVGGGGPSPPPPPLFAQQHQAQQQQQTQQRPHQTHQPQPTVSSQQHQQQPTTTTTASGTPAKDPFADLAGLF